MKYQIDSPEWFEQIAEQLRDRGLVADTSWMGGGIICVFVHIEGYDLCFGTANETWGADVWIGEDFKDELSINTLFSSETEDPEACAIAIHSAVDKFIIMQSIPKHITDIEAAFWNCVVLHFPQAKTGDFPPDATFGLRALMQDAVRIWLRYNLPEVATMEDVAEVKSSRLFF